MSNFLRLNGCITSTILFRQAVVEISHFFFALFTIVRTYLVFSPQNRILLQIIVYWNLDDISCTFLTDASAEVFAKMSPEKQEEFLSVYYNEEGFIYSLGRTTIHSSDFGSGSHTYIEEGDKELANFSIEHDRQLRIPFIKRAIEAAGGELLMYASPWSPPAFMKTTNNMSHGGSLLPEYEAA
ncbi:MAG: hypothetical protein ACI9Y1_002652 [Lentisphaeria bacterium]|jgi:hypothetical protein